ncbi:MAG: PAS domain-containing protein [Candidatus Micrarchaeota archaeon]|nr:PAS domain-containing protein [Candidatus Micrarchaeota archaeon]
MADEKVSRFLAEVQPLVYLSNDDEALRRFASLVSATFGVDKAMADTVNTESMTSGSLQDYLVSTKKAYVDNGLSDYSSFPELINYRNAGFRSCCIVPMAIAGKSVPILTMLSKTDNYFDDKFVGVVSAGALLLGMSILYRSETSRSGRLANYFDAAFNMPDAQLLVSSDNRIVKSNKEARRLFPNMASFDSVFGVGFAELAALAKSGARKQYGVEINGLVRTFEISANGINDRLVNVMARDLTEQSIFRGAVELMGSGKDVYLALLDRDFAIKWCTDNFERLFGYPKGIILGKNIADFVSRGERERFVREAAVPRAQGTTTIEVSGSSTMLAHFAISGINGSYLISLVNADAEKYVEVARNSINDFINYTSDMVILANELGYVKECNMAAEAMLGYAKAELVGRDVKNLYADQSLFDRDVTYLREGQKVDSNYINLIKKDATQLPVVQSMRMMKDSEGGVSYLLVMKELMTKDTLSRLKVDMERAQNEVKELKRDSAQKTDFIYNISHELKTPLTSIKGFSTLLYNGEVGPLNDQQKDYVMTIIEEADRLTLIIQQVLDATKLEAQKVKLDLKDVDLAELENSPSIKALKEAAESKGLAFRWKAAYDLPRITADPNRLIQVFVNLIGNAIKFTEHGSITVDISNKSKKAVICKVIDTGIGVSDEDRRRLFKKFYQAAKKEGLVMREGSGTGLGLSITKNIVELHGGKVGVESTLGQGSTFWFILKVNPTVKKQK